MEDASAAVSISRDVSFEVALGAGEETVDPLDGDIVLFLRFRRVTRSRGTCQRTWRLQSEILQAPRGYVIAKSRRGVCLLQVAPAAQ